jgi:hypothetical protein
VSLVEKAVPSFALCTASWVQLRQRPSSVFEGASGDAVGRNVLEALWQDCGEGWCCVYLSVAALAEGKLNGPAQRRRSVQEVDDPNYVVLAERAINDYLWKLRLNGSAIDEEAAKGQGEDWSLMVGYVQSCREKLPGAIEESQKH